MRAKSIMPQTFKEFYDMAPNEIKNYIDKSKHINQSATYHPEGSVYNHIKIVFNRAKRTGDINLMLSAIFHDLGKVDTTKAHPTIPDKWSAISHEKVSVHLIIRHRDWIEEMGGNYDIVYYIVDQHMRVKNFPEMKKIKQQAMRNHMYFHYLEKFTEFDNMLTDYSSDID